MIPIKYYSRIIKFLSDKHSDSGTEQTQHSATNRPLYPVVNNSKFLHPRSCFPQLIVFCSGHHQPVRIFGAKQPIQQEKISEIPEEVFDERGEKQITKAIYACLIGTDNDISQQNWIQNEFHEPDRLDLRFRQLFQRRIDPLWQHYRKSDWFQQPDKGNYSIESDT